MLASSGQRGGIGWFYNQTSISRTLQALKVLAAEFVSPTGKSTYGDTVIAIELLNEPFPWDQETLSILQRFYRDGYAAVRAHAGPGSGVAVMLQQAFQSLDAWDGFMPEEQYVEVAMDYVSWCDVTCSRLQAHLYDSTIIKCEKTHFDHWTLI